MQGEDLLLGVEQRDPEDGSGGGVVQNGFAGSVKAWQPEPGARSRAMCAGFFSAIGRLRDRFEGILDPEPCRAT